MLIALGVIAIVVASGGVVVAVTALLRGHLDWARLNSRKAASAAVGGSVGLLIIGVVFASSGQPSTATKDSVATHAGASIHAASPSERAQGSAKSGSPASRASASAALGGKSAAPQARSGTALALLATLPVKGRAPKTGYARDLFGSAWTDDNSNADGHNGCDTRNDILRRDLSNLTYKGSGCAIATGTLKDPYTGKTISFVRGPRSAEVQIDHMVALSDAWQTGAQQLSSSARINLANDPVNLVASDGPTNESKGDGDTATWLPSNKGYRCTYVAHQAAVKARYHLWVTSAEGAAMARVLGSCPTMTVPTARVAALPAAHSGSGYTPSTRSTYQPPAPKAPAPAPTSGASSVHPGSYCSPAGAHGISKTGKSEVCSTTANSPDRARWHAG